MRLNIYSQPNNHDPAVIVGDKEALTRLRDNLNHLLGLGASYSVSTHPFFDSDGERYKLYIVPLDDDDTWNDLLSPYMPEAIVTDGDYTGKLTRWDLIARVVK